LVAHLQFFKPHKAKQKNSKIATSQRTTTQQWRGKQRPRKKNEGITGVWQKWRFSAPQTHLWLIKVWFSASTFVMKIATFAKRQTVICHFGGRITTTT